MKLKLLLLLCTNFLFGQVGIGTTAPTKDLDINGELRIRNVPGSSSSGNTILSTDSEGNVKGMKTIELNTNLIGGFTNKWITTNGTSGEVFDWSFFSFTITVDSMVNFTVEVSFSDFLTKKYTRFVGSSDAKRYGFLVSIKENTDQYYYNILGRTSFFSSGGNDYTEDNVHLGASKWASLTPGTYDLALGRFLKTKSTDTEGLGVLLEGDTDYNVLQIVTIPK